MEYGLTDQRGHYEISFKYSFVDQDVVREFNYNLISFFVKKRGEDSIKFAYAALKNIL